MARVPLVEDHATAEIAALSARIRGARRGKLHAFYRALMHAPGLAAAWFDFNNAVRFDARLGERPRELAILRVAALTGCDYVWEVHRAQYAGPAGVTEPEIENLRSPGQPGRFAAGEEALLRYVEAMTRDVGVPDAVYEAVRLHLGTRELVELTVLVAAYNMHVRVLRALDIRLDEE